MSLVIGSVIAFAGPVAPRGWLLCCGQNVKRTSYAFLFDIIGTTYGEGDGETTFGLPDCRGRAVFGRDDMGDAVAGRITQLRPGGIAGTVLGAAGGEEAHVLSVAEMPVHRHGVSDPMHAHPLYDPGHVHDLSMAAAKNFANGSYPMAGQSSPSFGTGSAVAAGGTGIRIDKASTGIGVHYAGFGLAHNLLPPGIILNAIIYAGE